jgi:pyruvate kinase
VTAAASRGGSFARHRVQRKTKLIATIGPACDSPETIKALIRAGMNVARLNFSHGTHEEHRKRLAVIRQASEELGANIATMLDTKGVEIRTGRVEGGSVNLTTGDSFTLHTDDRTGDARGVSVSYRGLPEEVAPDSLILIDDGVIELRVVDVGPREIRCRITRGGRLGDRKGVNLPDTPLALEAMTPENRDDLFFAIEHDVTYIAASSRSADVPRSEAAPSAACASRSSPRSRTGRGCGTSRRSSRWPTAPWSRAETWAWRSRCPRCRSSRSRSSAPPS